MFLRSSVDMSQIQTQTQTHTSSLGEQKQGMCTAGSGVEERTWPTRREGIGA